MMRQSAENPTVGQYDREHPDYMQWFCPRCNMSHPVPEECPHDVTPPRDQSPYAGPRVDLEFTGDPRAEQEAIFREVSQ